MFDQREPSLSFWDRLIEGVPETRNGDAFAHRRRVDFSRMSLLVDLEKLLNTRPLALPGAEQFPHLEHSILNYGLRDFSGSDLCSDKEVEELRSEIERTIVRYEPRLREVCVNLLPRESEVDHCVRFEIQAMLAGDLEAVYVQADLTTATGQFRLMEGTS